MKQEKGGKVVATNPNVQQQELMAQPDDEESWGAGQDVNYDDLLIPRLLIAQSLSKVRNTGVEDGQIYDSVLRTKLEQPVKMICIDKAWTWRETILPKKFKAEYPLTSENANQPNVYESSEGTVRRDKVLSYYVLLVEPLSAFPAVVSFSRGSLREGKRLLNIFVRMAAEKPKRPSAAQVVHLKTDLVGNEKGDWFSWIFSLGRSASAEEIAAAKRWADIIKTQADSVRVHSANEAEDVVETVGEFEDLGF